MRILRFLPALLLFASLPALAQTDGGTLPDGGAIPSVDCASLDNTIWMEVGATQEPLIKALGAELIDSGVMPMRIVYLTNGSCVNIEDIYNKNPLTVTMSYIPTQEEKPGWDAGSPSLLCNNTTGHAIDVANSALFVSTCDPSPPPDDVELVQGPIQAYALVVPNASSQTAMTAEEAYNVFGFGDNSLDPAWDNHLFLYTQPSSKSTLLTWAATIDVPANKWQGTPQSNSTAVLNKVIASTDPEATVGLLGSEVYDANRGALKDLAFQWFGQHHAWYPDSSFGSRDKQNLRDGHYAVWSPTVWMTHIDPTTKAALDPRTAYFINLVLAATQAPAFDFNTLDTVIGVGLVPDCAMKVNRTVEAGPLSAYTPDEPCGCYYESKVGSTPSCTTCTTTCANGGVCRLGYCEAR